MPKLTNAKVNYFGQCARLEGDTSPGVYALIDYYTAVFNHESIAAIIDWIGLDPSLYCDDFYASMIELSAGYDNKFIFSYENIKIDVMSSAMQGFVINDEIFYEKLPKVRLEISGSGLMFLRRQGIDVDRLYRDSSRILPTQHITRMDFAYDLINYKPEMLDQLIEYCRTSHTASGRIIRCTGENDVRGSAITCEIKDVSQKTVYLGSSASDRMLRVYDKRLQHIDRESGVYQKANPYGNPDTWIRIEMQTRNRVAHELGLDGGDLTAILREIYKFYCFADPNTTHHNRKPAQFWVDLFDWEELDRTVQNIKFVHVEDFTDKIDGSITYFLQTIFLWLVKHGGFNALEKRLTEFLYDIQRPEFAYNPLIAHRKMNNFFNKLKMVLPASTFEEYFNNPNSFFALGSDNKLHLRDKSIDDPTSYAFYSATLADYRKRIDDLERENARLMNLYQVHLVESSDIPMSYKKLEEKYQHVLSLCIAAGLGDLVKG